MHTRISERPTLAVSTETLPARCRHRFPIFQHRVYINSCAQGALSDAVRASYEQYLSDWDEYGAPWEYWVERGEAARASFADLVNAAPDEFIALIATYSINIALGASERNELFRRLHTRVTAQGSVRKLVIYELTVAYRPR